MSANPICVICEKVCEDEWGNNPQPFKKEGRCCDECNEKVVIPHRINEVNKECITLKGLKYRPSTRLGECGIRSDGKLYFPMFLMGACGHDECVISWNGKREILVPPNEMNYKWFKSLATRLKKYSMFDWDWCSFRDNILATNKEHLMNTLKINQEKLDRFLSDGYVFLNHFEEDWGKGEKEEMKKKRLYFPNFKNFLERNLNELEY